MAEDINQQAREWAEKLDAEGPQPGRLPMLGSLRVIHQEVNWNDDGIWPPGLHWLTETFEQVPPPHTADGMIVIHRDDGAIKGFAIAPGVEFEYTPDEEQ